MKKLTILCALVCLSAFQSCNKLDFAGFIGISNTSVNERFAASMKLLETAPVPDINVSSNDYEMILVTDIHCDGKNDRLERFVSACVAETGMEKAVLCLGDIVNGRNYHSEIHSKLKPLSEAGWRFLNTLGNHDTYFNEFHKFSKYWPLTTYTFKVNLPSGESDFFICLDSAEGSCGTSQRSWLENRLKEAAGKYRNIFVFTHTNFFNTDNTQITSGNFSLEETYDLLSLFSTYGVSCVLTGHDHHFEYCRFRGVSYYTFNALCNDVASYYKITFGKEMTYKEIHL